MSQSSSPVLTEAVRARLRRAFSASRVESDPYRHWLLSSVFPPEVAQALHELPLPAADLRGLSGKREMHNDQRRYFDQDALARFEVCAAVAAAFQSTDVVQAITAATGAVIDGGYVRLEYAQDNDGFWLEPHTDLGVKRFTLLIYLAESADQIDAGTDLYSDPTRWAKRPPFTDNTALAFVPGSNTWHGFEPRPLTRVRKSVIMNYVTDDWRAREQLSYPTARVRA